MPRSHLGGSGWLCATSLIYWSEKILRERSYPFTCVDTISLTLFALEALACRVARLDFKCETGTLSPVRDWRLYLPQSITWLRLVAGTWLFVASSDNHISKISCWDLTSVFQGHREPLTEAYLPGQVKTGKLEVQDSGVVLALGLGAESLAVHVITFRKHSGRYIFSELCRIDGSLHVLILCGDLVGCGLRNGVIQPHVVNWKDDWIDDIPELDIRGKGTVPHLMTISKNALVVVRTNALQVYTLRSNARDLIALVKLVEIPTVWEVAVCSPSSKSSPNPSLRLIVLSPIGVEMCIVDFDVLAELDDQHLCRRFVLAKSPRYYYHDEPWYRPYVGGTS
ncbi:F-box domain-containing protein [Mycena venus]|uniref:F-box domain-containing protein n=1 Tax=Mycena venus TaxID=2733690 RepID=A0A8H6X7H5_9AGAR|nr:F-box domain-containing protein [Mycena venus]